VSENCEGEIFGERKRKGKFFLRKTMG